VGLNEQALVLEIPPGRLAKAREALVQATRVALSDVIESDWYDPRALLREWERLHPQAIDSVISLRGAQLKDTWDSETVATELVPLFAEMIETDPIRFRQLLRARSFNPVERNALLNRIIQHRLETRVWEGSASADQITEMLRKAQRDYPEFQMIFEIRGLLIRQLSIENRIAEARGVAETIPPDFKRCASITPWLIEDFGQGIRWLGQFTPDIFLTGFDVLDEALHQPSAGQAGYKLLGKDGIGFVSVTWADRVRLKTVPGLRPTEPAWEQLFASRPELRELVKRVNLRGSQLYLPQAPFASPRDQESQLAGEQLVSKLLDRSYRAIRGSHSSSYMMQSSMTETAPGLGPELPNEFGRGTPSPSWPSTRSRLARQLGTKENFDLLFRYASSRNLADKCRREALKISYKLLDEASDPLLRARLLTGILPLERRVGDRSVAADHLADARKLLNQLRETPPSRGGGAGPEGIRIAIDAFERVVVAEWAWVDYPGAASYATSLSGFNRHAVFLDIARLLSLSPFYRNWPNTY